MQTKRLKEKKMFSLVIFCSIFVIFLIYFSDLYATEEQKMKNHERWLEVKKSYEEMKGEWSKIKLRTIKYFKEIKK